MRLTVNVRVTARTGDKVKASIAMTADVGPFLQFGMDTAGIAEVAGLDNPDSGEVRIECLDNAVCDALEFPAQAAWLQETVFHSVETMNPFLNSLVVFDLGLNGCNQLIGARGERLEQFNL
jgi:hypothetical protein